MCGMNGRAAQGVIYEPNHRDSHTRANQYFAQNEQGGGGEGRRGLENLENIIIYPV